MHGPHSQSGPAALTLPRIFPSPAILSLARPQLPRLPSSRSKSALAPFPHSSLRSMGRTNQILPGLCLYPPLCVPQCPRGQPRPSGPGGEDGLTWPLPVFWPHHSATLHIIVALVTLTYLGFPRRAWLAQDSRLCSCESLSGVATPPTPSLLACPLCLHPCLAPLIGDTGRALETGQLAPRSPVEAAAEKWPFPTEQPRGLPWAMP